MCVAYSAVLSILGIWMIASLCVLSIAWLAYLVVDTPSRATTDLTAQLSALRLCHTLGGLDQHGPRDTWFPEGVGVLHRALRRIAFHKTLNGQRQSPSLAQSMQRL
ncbi:hypothetical protein BR93DRAFT_930795, partial [Coniochaeta sp. PMI_546]